MAIVSVERYRWRHCRIQSRWTVYYYKQIDRLASLQLTPARTKMCSRSYK